MEWHGARWTVPFAALGAGIAIMFGAIVVAQSATIATTKTSGSGLLLVAVTASSFGANRTIRPVLSLALVSLPLGVMFLFISGRWTAVPVAFFVALGLVHIAIGLAGFRRTLERWRHPPVLRLTSEGIERSDGPLIPYGTIAAAETLAGGPAVALTLREPRPGFLRRFRGYDVLIGEDVRAKSDEILAALEPRFASAHRTGVE